MAAVPTLTEGDITIRRIRLRDSRSLERELVLQPQLAAAVGGDEPARPDVVRRAGEHPQPAAERAGRARAAVRDRGGRRARRPAERVVDQLRVALVGDDRLLGGGAVRGPQRDARPRWPSRPTTASSGSACTGWRSASGRRTSASLRVVEKLGFRYEGLRRRYIHINGDWRDHFCFALTVEELPQGVLRRWLDGKAPASARPRFPPRTGPRRRSPSSDAVRAIESCRNHCGHRRSYR